MPLCFCKIRSDKDDCPCGCNLKGEEQFNQVAKQADVDTRQAALRDKDYSVEKEPTGAKNANSRGKKSAATKKKKLTTTKEV